MSLVQQAIKISKQIDFAKIKEVDELNSELDIIVAQFSEEEEIEYDEYLQTLIPKKFSTITRSK